MDPPKEISIANDIFCDSKGNIWLATSVGELIYYNRGKWNYYCKLPSSIFAIEEDNYGQIWLGTGKGIYIMECP